MKVQPYTDTPLEEVDAEGAKATQIRWMISDKDGAPTFAMRMFEVQPGGFTPYHAHPWEHEVFVLEGEGMFITDKDEIPFKAGHVIFADPQMKHQFKNTGSSLLRFLCLIPNQSPTPQPAKKPAVKVVNPFGTGRANNC